MEKIEETESTSPINLLAEALNNFQSKLVVVNKTAENPFFKSKYADLASIMLEAQPVLSECGLSIVQLPDNLDGKPALTTFLMHKSGQFIKSTIPLILAKQDSQAVGSAITYMRRYGYAAALQIVIDEDDDGNATTAGKLKPSNLKIVEQIKNIWKESGGTEDQLVVWVKKNNNDIDLEKLDGDRQQTMLKALEEKKAKKDQGK